MKPKKHIMALKPIKPINILRLGIPLIIVSVTLLILTYYYGNYTLIFQISGSILWVSGIVCLGLYFLKFRPIHVSVVTYESVQKIARSKGKTIEEMIEKVVTELQNKSRRKRKSSK